jgi:lycopene cyclase domain-containing protein
MLYLSIVFQHQLTGFKLRQPLKYTYLLINFLTVLFPVMLSFDKRVQFYKSWKFILPGITITGIVFLFWDVLFTIRGVWSFNNSYITGIVVFHLPIEEILFFITVPFACLFIYACLNYYLKWNISKQLSSSITGLICISSALLLVFYYHRLYTLITLSLVLVLLLLLKYVFKVNWLGRFYRTYFIALVPFYIVNGLLTSIPVVIYNNTQNLDRRVGTIPIEDHFYLMAMLLMNIGLFEYFRPKYQQIK